MSWLETCTEEEFNNFRKSKEFKKFFNEGMKAFKTNDEPSYPYGSKEHWAWMWGWEKGFINAGNWRN